MDEIYNDNQRSNWGCSRCLSTDRQSNNGQRIDGTIDRSNHSFRGSGSITAFRDKTERWEAALRWAVVAMSFIGLTVVAFTTLIGG